MSQSLRLVKHTIEERTNKKCEKWQIVISHISKVCFHYYKFEGDNSKFAEQQEYKSEGSTFSDMIYSQVKDEIPNLKEISAIDVTFNLITFEIERAIIYYFDNLGAPLLYDTKQKENARN